MAASLRCSPRADRTGEDNGRSERRSDQFRMTFFALGSTHHDLAGAEVEPDAPGPTREAVRLSHVAFKIGDDIETLKQMVPNEPRDWRAALGLRSATLGRRHRTGHRE